ncbi:MAG: hypothetical protein HIU92_02020 [Proteobacteria bacterium]|nr:hypothetical protein [Pseudomonadota bacterium]
MTRDVALALLGGLRIIADVTDIILIARSGETSSAQLVSAATSVNTLADRNRLIATKQVYCVPQGSRRMNGSVVRRPMTGRNPR